MSQQEKDGPVITPKYNPQTHGTPAMNEPRDKDSTKPEIEEPVPHPKVEEPVIAKKHAGNIEKEAGYKNENGNPPARKKEDVQNDAGIVNDEPVEESSDEIGSKGK